MTARHFLALAFFGLVASACTVIVGNQLSKYNDYKVSDSLHPGSQNVDPCALTAPDAGNACSACIAQSCPTDYARACQPDGSTTPWFDTMQRCAASPVQGYVDGRYEYNACSPYDKPDAQAISGDDVAARERAALICVRDKCYQSSPTPPCYQCSVGIQKPGSGAGVAVLHDSECGRCLEQACAALLVRCCDSNIPDGLSSCAYPQDPAFKGTCVTLLTADAGKQPLPTANMDDKCKYDLATTCYAQCVDTCSAGK